ncbi:hypothetical protein Q31a_20860 [Aureliella helgolandensis]|uniref:Uncharacterized protein n=1 Tax=Aureliella helgolandensis TaxID=2527968 RepID=A0A518G5B9_9BACT|nr:hypothetical protein Q31a_20860 [Aureliella helgolandensis]
MNSDMNNEWEDASPELLDFAENLKQFSFTPTSGLAPRVGKRAATGNSVHRPRLATTIPWERYAWVATVGIAFCTGLWTHRSATSPVDDQSPISQMSFDSKNPSMPVDEASAKTSSSLEETSAVSSASFDAINHAAVAWLVGANSSPRFVYDQRDPLTYWVPEPTRAAMPSARRLASRAELLSEIVPGPVSRSSKNFSSSWTEWFSND